MLAFDVTIPPYDNLDVRRGISMAINREAIRQHNLEGNLSVARAVVPQPIAGARDAPCAGCVYDPAEARRLLGAAGVGLVTLAFNRDGGHERIAEAVRDDLRNVGVGLQYRRGPRDGTFGQYVDALAAGGVGLFRFGSAPDHPTMGAVLYDLFHSSRIPGPGDLGGLTAAHLNYMRYANPEVDALLDEARAESDQTQQRSLYQRVERLVLEDQVVVPLFTYRHAAVSSERVEGLRYGPMGLLNLVEISVAAPTESR
jgi:peptide/nickel transport system substrate-binding protein/oligopeptide transport system substrate-binding protein